MVRLARKVRATSQAMARAAAEAREKSTAAMMCWGGSDFALAGITFETVRLRVAANCDPGHMAGAALTAEERGGVRCMWRISLRRWLETDVAVG